MISPSSGSEILVWCTTLKKNKIDLVSNIVEPDYHIENNEKLQNALTNWKVYVKQLIALHDER